MREKLNWLFLNTYPGQVLLQPWLAAQGIDRRVSWKYVASGLLERIDTGVYCRTGKKPDWIDAIQCLQTQWNKPIHISGLSSLNLQGSSHYLTLGSPNIWLTLPARAYLPKWLSNINDVTWLQTANNRLLGETSPFIKEVIVSGRKLQTSSLELAAYEIANNIPSLIGFSHANELFQGLISLNPKKVQTILSLSQSIQSNRIFLFLAKRNRPQWVKRLNESEIMLGSGTRQVEVGGKLDHEYKITVPSSLVRKSERDGLR